LNADCQALNPRERARSVITERFPKLSPAHRQVMASFNFSRNDPLRLTARDV
jgi:hypothetical protein